MKPKWDFPPTLGGNISGLNESGIAQFKSVPIRSMTKETLQDSLDARKYKDRPAIVKFNLFYVNQQTFPDLAGLKDIFSLGVEYWEGHNEAKKFYLEGLEMLNKDSIPIMAVQDYNTSGLSKIGGNSVGSNSGGWIALVRSTGITEKGPTASGSFGIGKHAPFAASKLQTVLYGTVNEENEIGFQGVSKITSFLDRNNEEKQGTGYFGFSGQNNFYPIKDSSLIQEPFRRSQQGTDKFIVGFEETDDWEYKVLKEAISSYMVAIIDEKLEVEINGKHLNKDTLKDSIKMIQEKEPNDLLIQFYEALTNKNSKKIIKEFETESGTKEEIELHLLDQEDFNRRIALYRNTGMKIYDRGHFRTPTSFAGVLIVKGNKLNETLREMEPPTHDKWDPELYKSNIRYARKLMREINGWMNEATRELVDLSEVDSIELKGLEKLLPDLSSNQSSIVSIKQRSLKQRTKRIRKSKPKENTRRNPGVDLGGNDIGITSNPPERSGEPKGRSKKETGGTRLAKISKYKVYHNNMNEDTYTVRFWPSTEGERHLTLSSVGENNNRSQVTIVEANAEGQNIAINDNVIGPVTFKKDAILDLKIKIKSKNKLSLEVKSV